MPPRAAQCRFGSDCNRPDCWFEHPQGRNIDNGSSGQLPQGQMMPGYPPMYHAGTGHNSYLGGPQSAFQQGYYPPPQLAPQFAADMPYYTGNALKAMPPPIEPDEDRECYSSDEEGFGLNCPCCHGNPYSCLTQQCAERGSCGCVFGQSNSHVEDETWKDEWFAASRFCKCCEGYIYRCKKEEDMCQSGNCHCSVAQLVQDDDEAKTETKSTSNQA